MFPKLGMKRRLLLLLSLCCAYIIISELIKHAISLNGLTATHTDTEPLVDRPMVHHAQHSINASNATGSNQEYRCDPQNSPDFLPDGNIIKRSLHAAIIGTMKGGTQALQTTLLKSDDRILSCAKSHGELHFFDYQALRRGQPKSIPKIGEPIPRHDLRNAFVKLLMSRRKHLPIGTRDISRSDINEDKFGIHSSPIYLFGGRTIATRMLCVAPWIKILAVLRNPIARAFSHYNYRKVTTSFEQYIQEDIALLNSTGVIRDWDKTDFESYSGSSEEFEAWERYFKKQDTGVVGRGLYAVQLELWMDEFRKIDKSIESDLLVFQSEYAKENPTQILNQALAFLGLSTKGESESYRPDTELHPTNYTHAEMSNDTYNLLYELYEPYNKRLYKLLGEDAWGGAWDDS